MEEQLEQSKKRLHFCVAVIGGWFGAYMVLRFGHFASAATVNLLEMLTGAAQSNWELALLRLGGVVLYASRPGCPSGLTMTCGSGPFSLIWPLRWC